MKADAKEISRLLVKGNYYYICDFVHVDGRRERIYGKTEEETRKKVTELEQEKMEYWNSIDLKNRTLTEYIDYYVQFHRGKIHGKKLQAILSLKKLHFENAEINQPVNTLTLEDVQKFYDAIQRNCTPAKVKQVHELLEAIFEFATEHGTALLFDYHEIDTQKEKASDGRYIPTPDELEKLKVVCQECINEDVMKNRRGLLLYIFGILSGIPVATGARIKNTDFDWENGTVKISKTVKTVDEYHLPKECLEWLKKCDEDGTLYITGKNPKGCYRGLTPESTEWYVFSNTDLDCIPVMTQVHQLNYLLERSGLPYSTTFKTIRKAFIVKELLNGVSIEDVCERYCLWYKGLAQKILEEYQLQHPETKEQINQMIEEYLNNHPVAVRKLRKKRSKTSETAE